MEIKKITREEEARLPRFRSRREACMYFELKYGSAFRVEDSFTAGEGDSATVVLKCAIVLDEDAYKRGVRELTCGSMADVGEFLASHQPVEIMLDGGVHVIH